MTKNILVIGGAGFVGSELVPKLLDQKYNVKVLDLFIFGDNLPSEKKYPNLKKIRGDIRELKIIDEALSEIDTVIHLACVANDPSFELDEKLSEQINYHSFPPIVKLAKEKGVKRFIFASSAAVYGIKKEEIVTENLSLKPITGYAKCKALCEERLLKEKEKNFEVIILRPATVCGYSPRLRLDVIVNIFTNQAYNNKLINVFGGKQVRPNIHISDMIDAYIECLKFKKDTINGQIFNVGSENYPILDIANEVKKEIKDTDIDFIESDDIRSYKINSDKITEKLNFVPKKNISDAIRDLVEAFEKRLIINPLDNSNYYNLKKFKEINLK